jgi:hypothetical protein
MSYVTNRGQKGVPDLKRECRYFPKYGNGSFNRKRKHTLADGGRGELPLSLERSCALLEIHAKDSSQYRFASKLMVLQIVSSSIFVRIQHEQQEWQRDMICCIQTVVRLIHVQSFIITNQPKPPCFGKKSQRKRVSSQNSLGADAVSVIAANTFLSGSYRR